jgi:hypothetical protein
MIGELWAAAPHAESSPTEPPRNAQVTITMAYFITSTP